jgi:tetratricopeptide (TPR) repeat protein
MAALAAKYPTNVEVLALYADALMILHPWDLYHGDGKPKAWTPQLVEVLEKGLGIDTEHPGLNHYYIHAVEGSSNPGRGITSADKLDRIVPGASHMVHMPSHIYIRTGNYARSIAVNEAALRGYKNYLAIYPKVAAGDFLYQVHNTHMMAACAIMNGNMAKAIQVSKECVAQVPEEYHHMDGPMAEFMQYASATPIFAYIRYGQWDQLLAPKTIADSSLYLRILYAFGRGFAHARQGRISAAEAELTSLTYIMENNPKLNEKAFNSAYDGANVAKHMLGGVIAELKKDYKLAAVLLRQAAELEEGMVYNEPKDWILPPLPYLGNVLLKDNQFMEAEKVFRKDLAFNPSNLWSLRGLMLAQLYQGKKSEANKTSKVLAAAMVYSDFGKLEGAVF